MVPLPVDAPRAHEWASTVNAVTAPLALNLMPPLSRHKSKGAFSDGPLSPAGHESGPISTIPHSPDLEEDCLIGTLSPLGAHRDAIVADMPHDAEVQEASAGMVSAESSPHAEQTVLSPPHTYSEGTPHERRREVTGAKAIDSRAETTPAPTSRRKKPLTTDHEQGGGGGAGDSGRKRSVSASPFRKRAGKSSQFASLVVPDESILDYLVSTVARWLERLRDKFIRVLSPSSPKQNPKKQGKLTDEEELALTFGTSPISPKRAPRKGARRATPRAPHRGG